jgi:outer membrane protein assembly factor BamB
MRKATALAFCLLLTFLAWQAVRVPHVHAAPDGSWLQWGRDAQHDGATPAVGVIPTKMLADIVYDPFAAQEQAEENGELLEHYQVPLIDGDMVFMEVKTGTYTSCNPPGSHTPYPCGPDAWAGENWNETAFQWQNGQLVQKWNYWSDWKPEPNSNAGGRNEMTVGLEGWEPVFHAAVGGGYVYVPGGSGSVYKLRESDGTVVGDFSPFGNYTNVFVSSPLTLDAAGNLYYTVLALDNEFPWTAESRGAFLVKISPQGVITKATFATLIPDAPIMCFNNLIPCGNQRPAINAAPVISPDGSTVYIVSRAQFLIWSNFLVAVNTKDLTPKWDRYLFGVRGPGEVSYVVDFASSSPVVTPDGSILFGVLDAANGAMMKFSPQGEYLAYFNFGWDSTPAVFAHDGTYSVILKDNLYVDQGPYFMTELNSDMQPIWAFRNNTIDSGHPHGYEWCVNAPAVDANGTVYANSEDGNVYIIDSTGKLKAKMFLKQSIEAAYTPVAVGPDGKIYAENDGELFVLGN